MIDDKTIVVFPSYEAEKAVERAFREIPMYEKLQDLLKP
jgi:hypothetical protein